MSPVLLVGFAEALSAPEVVFSLMDAGFQVRLFTRKGTPNRLAKSTGLDIVEITAPEKDVIAARKDLLNACNGVNCLFALDDVSLRLCGDIAEQTADIRHVHASGPLLRYALDKELQIDAATKAGLSVPQSVVLRHASDLPQDFPLPAIAKPAQAVEISDGKIIKGDVHYLMTWEDADAFRQSGELSGPLIVQPLIHGIGEGVFGLATPNGVLHWSGHRRLRMMNPHGSGSSACEVLNPEQGLRDRIEQMMAALEWTGPFMIELLRDDNGTAWFMELNGRVWGSMALARRNGFEYPAWAVQSALDAGFEPQRGPQRRQTVRHLGREILHLLFLLRGPKTEFHRANWPKFSTSLKAVLRPGKGDGFYNFHPQFPGFYKRDAWDTVVRALRK